MAPCCDRPTISSPAARKAPHPAAATFSPQAGRRGYAATSPFPASLSHGTSPRPVFTGVRRTGRDEWLDPGRLG
ncbi:hypothetical protein CHY08_13725 [Rhizobium leguminosarum bv. viciae]|nr:hypothetical protein CHY08_13725 [Rhizobium leguminosarum bv. viciae]